MNTILAKLASIVIAPFILIGGLFSPEPIVVPENPAPIIENQSIPVGGGSGTIEKLPQLITSKDEGTTLTSRTASFDFVGAGVSSSNVGNAVTVTISGGGGGGGTDVALDLGDNGSNESSAISEIAITGDTNSIFTEPSADKLLIAVGNDWPKADVSDLVTFADAGGDTTTFVALGTSATGNLSPATDAGLSYNATTNALTATTFIGGLTGNASTATALAVNGANCSASNAPLGVDASGGVESCTDFEEELNNSAGLLAALSDETGTGLAVFGTAPTFTTRITVPEIVASGSAGVDVHNNSATQVALFGAGGGIGTSLFGTTNIGSASADYLQIAGGTGSLTLTGTGSSSNIDITLTPKGSGVVNTNTLTLTGTGTLNGLDAIDGTGETTLESVLDLAGDVSATGLGNTVIGNDKILESMLKAVDTPSDEECLSYESTVGDFEWQACGSGGGTPGGSDTQLQFNDGGSFGGDAGLVYDKTTDALTLAGIFSAPTLTLTGTGTINGLDAIDATTETTLEGAIDIAGDISGTGLTAVTIGADKVLESMLKSVDAASDEECLTYESTVGDFEWQTCGSGGSVAGSDTQIQFNDGGAFGGDAGLTYNKTTDTLTGVISAFTTSMTSPLIVGGSGTTQALTYKTTTGIGATGADHIFQVGNNGATEAMRIFNSGRVGFNDGSTEPTAQVAIIGNSLGTTQTLTSGLVLENTTAATSGNQQISPALRLSGKGWKTNATAASQDVSMVMDVLPVQGTTAPAAQFRLRQSVNGGAFTDVFTIASALPTYNFNNAAGQTRWTITDDRVSNGFTGGATLSRSANSASAPNFSFVGDTDNGMYQSTTNNLDFSTAGTNALNISSTQNATFAGYVSSKVFVSAKSSTPYTVLTTESNAHFTNEGASAKIVFNLPTAAANLKYTFCVQDADGIDVTANTGDTIRRDTSVTATGGTITSTSIGSCITIVAINATEWFATSIVGTWS